MAEPDEDLSHQNYKKRPIFFCQKVLVFLIILRQLQYFMYDLHRRDSAQLTHITNIILLCRVYIIIQTYTLVDIQTHHIYIPITPYTPSYKSIKFWSTFEHEFYDYRHSDTTDVITQNTETELRLEMSHSSENSSSF